MIKSKCRPVMQLSDEQLVKRLLEKYSSSLTHVGYFNGSEYGKLYFYVWYEWHLNKYYWEIASIYTTPEVIPKRELNRRIKYLKNNNPCFGLLYESEAK